MRKSGVFSAQRRQTRQRKRQKSNRFRSTKQQLRTYSRLLRTFLCRYFMTTTVKFPHGRFMEDVNSPQLIFLSPSKLGLGPQETSSEKISLYLALKASWNSHEKLWGKAETFLQWRFRCRHRRRCFNKSSLIYNIYVTDTFHRLKG